MLYFISSLPSTVVSQPAATVVVALAVSAGADAASDAVAGVISDTAEADVATEAAGAAGWVASCEQALSASAAAEIKAN